jgi:Trp operon repressor
MTPDDLAELVRTIERLDAERDKLMRRRNVAAAELLTEHTSRALGAACGVSHATILNWSAR